MVAISMTSFRIIELRLLCQLILASHLPYNVPFTSRSTPSVTRKVQADDPEREARYEQPERGIEKADVDV